MVWTTSFRFKIGYAIWFSYIPNGPDDEVVFVKPATERASGLLRLAYQITMNPVRKDFNKFGGIAIFCTPFIICTTYALILLTIFKTQDAYKAQLPD